jgi:hypothetical protein
MFRNLGKRWLSSELIVAATEMTRSVWKERYGNLPECRMRTEIDLCSIRSRNPGYCYQMAGWGGREIVRGKLYLYEPRNLVK